MFDQDKFKAAVLESVQSLVDANIIIGQSIVSGNITIIPVFKASIGIVAGGGASAESPLGGGGAGVSVTPVTFIVIDKDAVKVLSAGDTSTVERLMDAVPAVIDKITDILADKNPEEKSR
jgi:uncharacterized spore protein YtfJ